MHVKPSQGEWRQMDSWSLQTNECTLLNEILASKRPCYKRKTYNGCLRNNTYVRFLPSTHMCAHTKRLLYIHVERQTMPIIWCFWTVLLIIKKYNQHILSGDRRVCLTWVIFVHLNYGMSMEIWLYASSLTSNISEVLFSLRYDGMFILSAGWLQQRDGYI